MMENLSSAFRITSNISKVIYERKVKLNRAALLIYCAVNRGGASTVECIHVYCMQLVLVTASTVSMTHLHKPLLNHIGLFLVVKLDKREIKVFFVNDELVT